MAKSILEIEGWKNDKLSVEFEDSCLKCLAEKAGNYHTQIDFINNHASIGHYCLHTTIKGNKKKQHYKLRVKVRYYGDKSKHEHKENTHRQKINI